MHTAQPLPATEHIPACKAELCDPGNFHVPVCQRGGERGEQRRVGRKAEREGSSPDTLLRALRGRLCVQLSGWCALRRTAFTDFIR